MIKIINNKTVKKTLMVVFLLFVVLFGIPTQTNALTEFEKIDIRKASVNLTELQSGISLKSGSPTPLNNSEFGSVLNKYPDGPQKEGILTAAAELYERILILNEKFLTAYRDPNTSSQQKEIIRQNVDSQITAEKIAFKEDPRVKWGTSEDQSNLAAQNKQLQKMQDQVIYCWGGITVGLSIPGCIAIGSYFILYLSSWVLWVAALLFDITIDFSLSMHDTFARFSSIQYGWETFRNFVNLFFILILVYIAIATILRLDSYGYKKWLGRLVVAAILINFSMFFTKVIIDLSNMAAIVFYKQILNDAKVSAQNATVGIKSGEVAGSSQNTSVLGREQYISFGIMNALGMQSIWGVANNQGGGTGGIGDTKTGGNDPAVKAANEVAAAGGVSGAGTLNPWTMTLVGLGGSVFVLFLSFIFIAAAGMFLIRTLVLIFLVILSPLAFAAKVLPQTEKYSGDWWKHLTSNALFAPVYMMMMYVTLQMLWGGGIKTGAGLLSLFSNESKTNDSAVAIMFFILICFMLIASLTVASSLGARGAKSFEGWGKQGRSWGKKLAFNRLKSTAMLPVRPATALTSRGFDKLSRSQTLAKMATGNSAIGRFIGSRSLQTADNLAQKKMGAEKTYREKIALDQKMNEARAKLAESNLKQQAGESDKAYYERTGFRVGDLIQKKGENAAAYEKRAGVKLDGYEDGTVLMKKAIARAYGVETDDKGKPKDIQSGSYAFRANELTARAYVDKIKAKNKENASEQQIIKNKERLYKERIEKKDDSGRTIITPHSGLLLTALDSFKLDTLKRAGERLIKRTNKDNVEASALKMKQYFDMQHKKLLVEKDNLKARAKEIDDILSDPTKSSRLTNAQKEEHAAEFTRKSAQVASLQSDIDETKRVGSEISSILSKNEDLQIAQTQINTMSGIKSSPPPTK